MFIILSYDVNQKRVGKVLKVCRKYLVHVHRSVFEGIITEGKLKHLMNELQAIIQTDIDSVCIYCIDNTRYTTKYQIGVSDENENII